ncbi:MAG: glycine oxidase ThiO [Terriglobales bacterium]
MEADAVIVGAGLIGLALARELRRRGFGVTVLEAGEAARQASWAGAGMLAASQTEDAVLRPLARASARLYPTWVEELERETGMPVGYRPSGTLFLATAAHPAPQPELGGWERVESSEVASLEPGLRCAGGDEIWRISADHSVDNRALGAALLHSARARGTRVVEHEPVSAVESESGGMLVRAAAETYRAAIVVNAAGAWASSIAAPVATPVRPRKGQMLRLRAGFDLRHVIEGDGVYLVPRAQGRVLVGATVEDVGFAPGLEPERLEELRQRAVALVPGLATAEVEEMWAGYRPCSDDERPILGPTACPGYWIAAGHYRDGILLTPITAKIMASAIATGQLTKALDLKPFLAQRFGG